ncbi:PH domain-containing protein [Brachybacterium sp. P6-10-X1]|uniref:PH domain-containing protein n=1 Tax=Brachybacterium sp. P6-10-X1 TaxID=1903186 RepID=UPI001C12C170|nr:PH domain-containing protein [Brachybacterium sp. P6-10-X1]
MVPVLTLALLGLLIGPARWWLLSAALVLLVLAIPLALVVPRVRWRIHRWEATDDALYSRTGLLWEEWRAAPLSRIQTVDLDRGPLQRSFGLATISVSTASARGAVRISSLATGAIGLAAYGVVLQVFDWFQAVPVLIAWLGTSAGAVPLLVLLLVLIVGAVVIGAVGTLAVYVEGWWGYRLGRHEDGSLDLRRGLLVSRSTVFDGDRLRGVTLHEPLGLRRAGGARLDVIAVGVKAPEGDQKNAQSPALVPAAPRAVGAEVAGTILGAPVPDALRPHPPAARRKRFLRAGMLTAAGVVLAVIPALVLPSLWWIPALTAVVLALVTAVLARDNSRGLGHRVTDRHVALRKGSLFRRTDVLGRDDVLGWILTRSPFQRRAGLGTVVATSAGGSGAFRLPDVDAEQARAMMTSAGTVWEHLQVREPGSPAEISPRRGTIEVSGGTAGRRPRAVERGGAAPRDR